ncbi:MAG: hypothetical protein JWR18_4228 [Segetibacter sp.]|nr:hypothetical protein [Segetibacter sp.]
MPLDNDTPKVRNNPMPTPKDEAVIAAHNEAEKDIEEDGELSLKPEPIDDLDEGESARFEDGRDKGPQVDE